MINYLERERERDDGLSLKQRIKQVKILKRERGI